MSASKLNPNAWNGEERSGGYIAKNVKPTSSNSPQYKGRIYLAGIGWYWVSGWTKPTRQGEILALRVQEMTDEQAEKFCKPKPQGRRKAASHQGQNGVATGEGEIPF